VHDGVRSACCNRNANSKRRVFEKVAQSAEPYFEPVSEGICEVLDCSSPAKYRVSWAQGVIISGLCAPPTTRR